MSTVLQLTSLVKYVRYMKSWHDKLAFPPKVKVPPNAWWEGIRLKKNVFFSCIYFQCIFPDEFGKRDWEARGPSIWLFWHTSPTSDQINFDRERLSAPPRRQRRPRPRRRPPLDDGGLRQCTTTVVVVAAAAVAYICPFALVRCTCVLFYPYISQGLPNLT